MRPRTQVCDAADTGSQPSGDQEPVGPFARRAMSTALQWFKSSYSTEQGGDCLEVASSPHAVHVRDSKNADGGPALAVAPASWTAFLTLARG
ncbi:DUF397 domain-containing protein [Streptomyces sp. NPDC088747]|uniref:DUF397 domain-containing protein n=1 Tax=Streptomyces sp. NPDC088747 TaxID=3365886 RepID=UPI0038145610